MNDIKRACEHCGQDIEIRQQNIFWEYLMKMAPVVTIIIATGLIKLYVDLEVIKGREFSAEDWKNASTAMYTEVYSRLAASEERVDQKIIRIGEKLDALTLAVTHSEATVPGWLTDQIQRMSTRIDGLQNELKAINTTLGKLENHLGQ